MKRDDQKTRKDIDKHAEFLTFKRLKKSVSIFLSNALQLLGDFQASFVCPSGNRNI
jgi:sRNA-binding regulator protein Hfq